MTESLAVVHDAALLDANDAAMIAFREDVGEFCRRHGYEPCDIAWIEYVPPSKNRLLPSVAFGVILKDENGRAYLGCIHHTDRMYGWHKGDCHVAMLRKPHALIGELPDWWQPQPSKES